jgi:hypothetical protein
MDSVLNVLYRIELEGADNFYCLDTGLLTLTEAYKQLDRHPVLTALSGRYSTRVWHDQSGHPISGRNPRKLGIISALCTKQGITRGESVDS